MAASAGFMLVTKRNPIAFVRNYKSSRGMRWSNDIHDWLGGYPYESASAQEMQSFLEKIGFVEVRSFPTEPRSGFSSGGCGEYVYSRPLLQPENEQNSYAHMFDIFSELSIVTGRADRLLRSSTIPIFGFW